MNEIWLIGLGKMSYEYSKVLSHLKLNFVSIGRSKLKKKLSKYHKKIYENGLDKFLKLQSKPAKFAIVAVNIEELSLVTKKLISFGVKNILLEKPGALSLKDLRILNKNSIKKKTTIHIAYNRRYYSSVIYAKQNYLKNNKIISVSFDFTEIKKRFINNFPKKIIENWLICNSSHVIDLVFYFIGFPKYLNCKIYKPNFFREKKSIFIGDGLSNKNIPFSYHSNWSSAGNWNINIMTKSEKIIFNPLEKIKIQRINEFKSLDIKITDKDDLKFKPGLKKMLIDYFFNRKNIKLPTISDQETNFKYLSKIG